MIQLSIDPTLLISRRPIVPLSHQYQDTFPSLAIIEIIPTQRTTARVAALEPPEQTAAMKRVLTRRALLARQLPVRAHDAVANGALRLPLHRGRHVLPPRHEAVDDGVAFAHAAGGEVDDALGVDEPEAPLLLRDADAVDRVDLGAGERVGRGQADGDAHCLFVEGDRGGDFAGRGGDFDGHWLLLLLVGGGCGLRGGPVADDGEFLRDDERGNVFLRPGFDGDAELAGGAVAPPVLGDRGQPPQAEVVEVDEGSVGLVFWGLVVSQTGGLEVVFRSIDGFWPTVDENVEYEVQQILRVCAFLKCSDIIRLYFVACIFPVVECKLPAEDVTA